MEYPDDVITLVAERALEAWTVRARSIELFSRSENVVFRIEAEDGCAYALRVHRPDYHTLAELESEPLWTAALNEAGIGAPVAVRNRDGDHYKEVDVPGTKETRFVGLIPWFEGVAMNERIEKAPDDDSRDQNFERLGRLMATMHNQSAAWKPPSGFQRHALDADGLMGDAPFWGRFWELPQLTSVQRETISEARRQIHARLLEYGRNPNTYSMIHADLRSTNVLIEPNADGDRLHVIDFDDAGFGWHQYDIAVALFDYMTSSDYEPIHNALVGGYRSKRAISDEDLALVPMFLLARALASLGWLNARPEVDLYQFLPALIELATARAREFLDDL